MLRSLNVSVSTSKVCPVTLAQNHTELLVKVQKRIVYSYQTLSQRLLSLLQSVGVDVDS